MNGSSRRQPEMAAVVLAAGLSQRMGRPKMVLPWGSTTVIGQVVETVQSAGIPNIYVITGGERQQIEQALLGKDIHAVYNPDYLNGEMLVSFQAGLRALPDWVETVLVVLGDQPQIQASTIESVLMKSEVESEKIIVPSYHFQRGHPWLLPRKWWDEVLTLAPPSTLKDFLNHHASQILYVNVETPSILMDLDTPEDFQQNQPG